MTETLHLSRRRFLTTTSMAASAFALRPASLFAQTPATSPFVEQSRAAAANAKITIVPLRSNVSILVGSGGNIAVLTGFDGKLVVDSGYASSQPQVANALGLVSSSPVKRLINTHWHLDHTDGNDWMHSAGATILAHENTLKRRSTTQTIAAFNAVVPPAPAGGLPTETFSDRKTIQHNKVTLQLVHYMPAHTDSDVSVNFVEPEILHLGDTWFNGAYPFIDYSSGGNIDGMIHAATRNLAITTKETMIIPGHGPVGNKEQLTQYRDVLVEAREKIAALKQQGKTLDEVVAAKPMAKYDAKWGAGFVSPTLFAGLVYQGV
jgi:glyoxylase-like metal-dependent hydrolase (beta-lactamase superfamily II)